MNGKIARLPRAIRDELNRRLDNEEAARDLLPWLNSLPEVKALLAADFAGQPISRQNLHEWSQNGFRNWKVRQNALDFLAADDADDADNPALQAALGDKLTDKLLGWMALRYAAAAQALAPTDTDPEADLRRLRTLWADILALRRGDLKAKRLALEEKRFALDEAQTEAFKEDEFWEWTKRPDIRARLDAEYKKSNLWDDAIRAMVPELFTPKPAPDQTADPAILI